MKAVKESLYPFDLYTPESSFSFPFHSSDCAIGFRFPSMQTCLREVFWDAVYLRERRLSWMLIGESIIPFCLKMSWDWRYRSKWFQCWYVLFRLLSFLRTHTHTPTHTVTLWRELNFVEPHGSYLVSQQCMFLSVAEQEAEVNRIFLCSLLRLGLVALPTPASTWEEQPCLKFSYSQGLRQTNDNMSSCSLCFEIWYWCYG